MCSAASFSRCDSLCGLACCQQAAEIDDLDSGDEILDDGEETDQLPEDSERHVRRRLIDSTHVMDELVYSPP